VPLRGTLTMYLGEILVFVFGALPERSGADVIDSAV
jgi:hypothetical protein